MMEVYSYEDADLIIKKLYAQSVHGRYRLERRDGTNHQISRAQVLQSLEKYRGGSGFHTLEDVWIRLDGRFLRGMTASIEHDSPASWRLILSFYPSRALKYRLRQAAFGGGDGSRVSFAVDRFRDVFRPSHWRVDSPFERPEGQIITDLLKQAAVEAYSFVASEIPGLFSSRHRWLPRLEVFSVPEPARTRPLNDLEKKDPSVKPNMGHVAKIPQQVVPEERMAHDMYIAADMHSVLFRSKPTETRALPRIGRLFVKPGTVVHASSILWASTLPCYIYSIQRELWGVEKRMLHLLGKRKRDPSRYRWITKQEDQLQEIFGTFRVIKQDSEHARSILRHTIPDMKFGAPVNSANGPYWKIYRLQDDVLSVLDSFSEKVGNYVSTLQEEITWLTSRAVSKSSRALQISIVILTIVTIAISIYSVISTSAS